jgi:hypothetical protein
MKEEEEEEEGVVVVVASVRPWQQAPAVLQQTPPAHHAPLSNTA